MKNRNGFTLVELIAVIAILAVLLTIGGVTIVKVRENILTKEYDNLISAINIAAEDYHSQTGVNAVPVRTLLQAGKLQADSTDYENLDEGIHKGDPVLFNPIDGSPLNCAAVIFENDKISNFDIEKGCSNEVLAAVELIVGYRINGGEGNILSLEEDDWIGLPKKTDKLTLYVGDKLEGATWISSKAPDRAFDGNSIEITIPENGKVEETYTVSGKIGDAILSNEFKLRVDANPPIAEKYFVNEGDAWKNVKNIYVDIYDKESGVDSYAIVNKDACASGDFVKYNTEVPTVFKSIKENGKYTICVKDKAGHVTTLKEVVTATNIDTKPPIMTVSSASGNWSKNGSFTVKLQDVNYEGTSILSGFASNTKASFKYKWSDTKISDCASIPDTNKVDVTISGDDIYTSPSFSVTGLTGEGKVYVCPMGSIKDKAGNELENKPVSAVMLLDNTGPTCGNATGASTTWTNGDRTIKQACSDSESGCEKAEYSTTYTTDTKTGSVVIKDKLGNSTTCTYNVYVDKTAPTCGSVSGASTSWTNANRTVSVGCNDTGGSNCKNSTFSNTFSTNASTSSITISDNAGNTKSCPVNVYVDKTAPTCGSVSGASTTWTNGNRTVSVGCNDTGGSNCTSGTFSNTYSTDTKTSSITIKDAAGNTNSCSVNVYVDKTAPTCSLSASGTAVSLSSKNDTGGSGLASYGLDKSSTNSYNSATSTGISTGTFYGHVKDAAGNTASCSLTIASTNATSCNCYDYDVACGTRTESYSCTESYTGTCTRSVGYDCSYNQSYDCSYNESYSCPKTEYYSCTKTTSCTKTERYACGSTRKCCYRHGSYICDEYDCGSTTKYCTRTYTGTCTTTGTCSRTVNQTCSRKVSKTCSRKVAKTCYRDESYSCTKTRSATCYRDVTKYCTRTSCSTCYNCPSGYSKINNSYCYR